MEMERRLLHPQVLAFHPSDQIESHTPTEPFGKTASASSFASSSVQGGGKRRAAIQLVSVTVIPVERQPTGMAAGVSRLHLHRIVQIDCPSGPSLS